MKIAIITDSNSGMTAQEAKALGIFLLPMPVILNEHSYLEGIDIQAPQLFEAMEREEDYSTSQPSLGSVTDLWNSILAEGYDEIIHIPMTSGLSGSCQSASMLAEDYDGKVHVVDNHRISITLVAAAQEAKRMADAGFSAAEIKAYLERTALQASIYITVASLKHLQRGGRLSSAGAVLGTLLNIKPILSIQGEKIDAFAKVHGMKQCERKMVEALQHDIATRFGDVPPEKLLIGAAGTFSTQEKIDHWHGIVQAAFPDAQVDYHPLPCSIACHVGPDCAGIAVAVMEH